MTVGERSRVEEARREKLRHLRDLGVDPYAYAFDRTHTTREAVAAPASTPVRVAGRLVALRAHGKTLFAHLADATGRVQVYCKRDTLGEEAYAAVKLLDLGDIVGVAGHMFVTKTGEVTVWAETVTLLAKALRVLPFGKEDAVGERHGELADPELRFRQRYADLAVHPEVRAVFTLRADVIRFLRRFLDQRDYVEVETPVLQPLYGGALARPFVSEYHALDATVYLRIATELYLKRCVVGGFERVYELGKDFRNEGLDRLHNPEFTMLEFYEAYADYGIVRDLVETMVHDLVVELHGGPVMQWQDRPIDFSRPWQQESFVDLVRRHAGVDVLDDTDAVLRDRLAAHEVADTADMPRPKLIDELFKAFVEPGLEQPTFVLDHPLILSPLAKPKRGDPRLAERFELFVNGWELANAFSELNDPADQQARFEAQARARAAGDVEAHQIDRDYVRALEYGMPPTGGCGIGVDRLVMLLANRASIRDVLLFPMLRPED